MQNLQVFVMTVLQVTLFARSTFEVLSKNSPNVILKGNNNSRMVNNSLIYHVRTQLPTTITVGCSHDQPTQWIWRDGDDDPDQIINVMGLKKERGMNELDLTKFKSSLELDVRTRGDTNLSCSGVLSETLAKLDVHVTCVYIKDKGAHLEIKVAKNTPIFECFPNAFSNSGSASSPPNQPVLTIDTSLETATCEYNIDYGPKIRSCFNVDHCKAILFYGLSGRNVSKGKIGKLEDKGGVQSLAEYQPFKCAFCHIDYFDWTSYILLYPSFNPHTWHNFTYYENMEAAINETSVLFYALEADEHFSIRNIKPINKTRIRTEFAINETVEVVCIGVKYLYMKGFRFQIGGKKIADQQSQMYVEEAGRHITRQKVTLLPQYRNHSSISCLAPIWNSRHFKEVVINFNLTPPKTPNVSLVRLDDESREYDVFVCSYDGWPKPFVVWNISEELTLQENSTTQPVIIKNLSLLKGKWFQTRYVKKLELEYDVTCSVRNFHGRASTTEVVNTRHRHHWIIIIIASVSSICVLFVVGLIVGIMYWQYQKTLLSLAQKQSLTEEEINEFYSGGQIRSPIDCEALLLPYNSDYEIPRSQLLLDGSILGSGQFGLVLKGNIGTLRVAVKTIKPDAEAIHLKALLSELKVLQYVGAHRNIVNLVGAITENIKKREVFLILDFCGNGCLLNLLRQCRPNFVDFFNNTKMTKNSWPLYQNARDIILTTGNLINFSHDIACGMSHLESKNVIHGDLAARNVLVTEDLTAKICDFGLAKQLLHYSVYVQKIDVPMPLRWMAIESLQDMEFSVASDKWSFGILLWEIFSLGEVPYPGVQWGFDSYKMLLEGYRMEIPDYSNDSIYRLMLQCWSARPQERPSFQDIMEQLKKEEEMLQ